MIESKAMTVSCTAATVNIVGMSNTNHTLITFSHTYWALFTAIQVEKDARLRYFALMEIVNLLCKEFLKWKDLIFLVAL